MRRQTSKPSMPGIITSSNTMSGAATAILARHSAPLNAVTTSKYSVVSLASRSLTFEQIVEELHVEFVVLHDQDCLGFCIHFPSLRGPSAQTHSRGAAHFGPENGVLGGMS